MKLHPFTELVTVSQRLREETAIIHGREELTFSDFLSRVLRLSAWFEDELDVEPGDLLVFSSPRDIELPVAIWAALGARACIWMTGSRTDEGTVSNLGAWWRLSSLPSGDAMARESVALPSSNSLPHTTRAQEIERRAGHRLDDAGYLIATSGSTGPSKAVVVPVGNLCTLGRGSQVRGLYGQPGERDTVLWNADPAFDAAVQQWVRLARGDTLVLLSSEERQDADALWDLVRKHAPCSLDMTPSHLVAVDAAMEEVPPVRLYVGGEPISEALWSRLATCDDVEAWNVYGAAEATVNSLAARICDDTRPHLGQPLPLHSVSVLGPELTVAEPGVAGELYIAGDALAFGYLDAAMTATRFVAHPAGDGSRMFRSGDRVVSDEGLIRYIGRTDDFAKVRGRWVDVAQIAAILNSHPVVADGTVVVDGAGELTWCVKLEAGVAEAQAKASLTDWAMTSVDGVARPSRIHVLDALPRTINGKLDRRGLSRMKSDTSTRKALEESWTFALGEPPADDDAHFFRSGGHSLSALRLIGRLKKLTGAKITTRELYDHASFREILRLVDGQLSSQPATGESAAPNVFEDESGEFFVLRNAENQHSLWPVHLTVPSGWTVAYGKASKSMCLSFVSTEWTDIRPLSVRSRHD